MWLLTGCWHASIATVRKSHYFFCLHQSVTMTCLMTKTSVDQCSLHGCANVSLWWRATLHQRFKVIGKRSFTKEKNTEQWALGSLSILFYLNVILNWVLINELKPLIWKSVYRYHPMRLTPALGIQRCLTRLLFMLYWCSLRWNIWNWKALERHIRVGEIFYHQAFGTRHGDIFP